MTLALGIIRKKQQSLNHAAAAPAGADASLAALDGRTAFDFASTNRFLLQTPVYDRLRAARKK